MLNTTLCVSSVIVSSCFETSSHLVGTGTSVKAPSITAFCRRTNATNGASRKSTSPTSTFDASASLGNFFMNLFLSFGTPQEEQTLNVRFTPARFPVVIKQTILKGDNTIQVKYQTGRLRSTTEDCCISFLSWSFQDRGTCWVPRGQI